MEEGVVDFMEEAKQIHADPVHTSDGNENHLKSPYLPDVYRG